MKYTTYLASLLLVIYCSSCGTKNQDPNTLFSIEIQGNKKAVSNIDTGLRVTANFRESNWKSGVWTNGIFESGFFEGGIWYGGRFSANWGR